MELNTLKTPLQTSPLKKPIKHLSAFRHNSLVSKSGIVFKSIDHYISESLIQSYFPKQDQKDLDLLFINPEDIELDILEEKQQYEQNEINGEIFA